MTNVDANNFLTVEQAYYSSLVFFDAFSRPHGIPTSSANFGVWGFQSISTSFFDFGVINNAVCGFDPATAIVHGTGLLALTVPITVLVTIGLAFFLFRKESTVTASPSIRS